MKTYDKEQILEKVKEIWAEAFFYDAEKTRPRVQEPQFDVKVQPDRVDIRIWNMYSAPGLSFKQLFALAEFFDTQNINDDQRFNNEGCETCDYGSEYGFTLTVRPDKEKTA